jgi:hypothetical protein
MGRVAIGATDERRGECVIELLVVHVIFKTRFGYALDVAFEARFVLDWKDDHCWLLRNAGKMLERVPRRERDDGRATQDAFADVTIDALDLFFAMMIRCEVGCVLIFRRALVAFKIFNFWLCVTLDAKAIILFAVR